MPQNRSCESNGIEYKCAKNMLRIFCRMMHTVFVMIMKNLSYWASYMQLLWVQFEWWISHQSCWQWPLSGHHLGTMERWLLTQIFQNEEDKFPFIFLSSINGFFSFLSLFHSRKEPQFVGVFQSPSPSHNKKKNSQE